MHAEWVSMKLSMYGLPAWLVGLKGGGNKAKKAKAGKAKPFLEGWKQKRLLQSEEAWQSVSVSMQYLLFCRF